MAVECCHVKYGHMREISVMKRRPQAEKSPLNRRSITFKTGVTTLCGSGIVGGEARELAPNGSPNGCGTLVQFQVFQFLEPRVHAVGPV